MFKKYNFSIIPENEWAKSDFNPARKAVYLSRDFLVQQFAEAGGVIRLTVCTTSIGENGRWKDGISWDALQDIKNELGFSDKDAVEIYPTAADTVNVANMRHLWVVPEPVPFAWRAKV